PLAAPDDIPEDARPANRGDPGPGVVRRLDTARPGPPATDATPPVESSTPRDGADRADGTGPTGHLAGGARPGSRWGRAGVRRAPGRYHADRRPTPGRRHDRGARGHRRRVPSLLLARRHMDRVLLRQRAAESAGYRGQPGDAAQG